MKKAINKSDIEKIAKILKAEKITFEKDHFRLKITNPEERRILVLEIYPEIALGKTRGILVVVYTGNSHLQLHNCSGFVVSEELAEVTFVAEKADQLSGLVVERGASCSLYASLNRDLISSDFTQLGVEVMLSGVALSLAEEVLDPERDKPDKSG
ncbi:MAG: hypothetical protein JXA92_06685 [candidate division Zixibacteria bacterium]|nr:hypothetical protein [candidate division Zixibacteria bacterium]